jgi:hypothetical protein
MNKGYFINKGILTIFMYGIFSVTLYSSDSKSIIDRFFQVHQEAISKLRNSFIEDLKQNELQEKILYVDKELKGTIPVFKQLQVLQALFQIQYWDRSIRIVIPDSSNVTASPRIWLVRDIATVIRKIELPMAINVQKRHLPGSTHFYRLDVDLEEEIQKCKEIILKNNFSVDSENIN